MCYPQTIDILKTRSEPLGIELVIGDYNTIELTDEFFGIILQYPAKYGEVLDYSEIVKKSKDLEIGVSVSLTDLLSLSILTPPGEWGWMLL